MGKRDQIVFLEDILECIHKISQYVDEISEHEFKQNTEKLDAVIRGLKLSVKPLSPFHQKSEIRNQFSHIPWRETAGMRDIVIHEYFGISLDMIWKVATNEIPQFKQEIEK